MELTVVTHYNCSSLVRVQASYIIDGFKYIFCSKTIQWLAIFWFNWQVCYLSVISIEYWSWFCCCEDNYWSRCDNYTFSESFLALRLCGETLWMMCVCPEETTWKMFPCCLVVADYSAETDDDDKAGESASIRHWWEGGEKYLCVNKKTK